MKLNKSINTILALLTLVPPIFNPSDIIKNLKENRNKIITVLGEFVNDTKPWFEVEYQVDDRYSTQDYLKINQLIALSKSTQNEVENFDF